MPLPGVAVKLKDPEESDSKGFTLTSTLTGTLIGEFDAPGALIWILPEHVVVPL